MWRSLCVSFVLLICVKDSITKLDEFGHPFLNPRIVGGKDTNANKWPWMVSLNYANGKHFCGGSLITKEWVLTAAHCVDGEVESNIRAHLGRTQQGGDDPNIVVMEIKEIIIHKDYDAKSIYDDIALLQLSSTAPINDHIKTVSLAAHGSDFVAKTKSWITGWGDIKEKTPLPSPGILQETTVEVFDLKDCQTHCSVTLNNNMICAGTSSGGKGHSKGDSGGPMVSRLCSSWVQSGIISWFLWCAKPNIPDGYVRVSEYQTWIEDKIEKITKTKNQLVFVHFPPDQCSTASKTSHSCHGRCNEKYNAGYTCNCHADCKPTQKCCGDYDRECNA